MNLLNQLLEEGGADTSCAITLIPNFGAYLKNVKEICDFSPERISLKIKKMSVTVTGNALTIGKFFQGDLFISGNVGGISVE